MPVLPVDARAKQILLDSFWTSKGWLDDRNRHTPPADLAYAKRHGLMSRVRTPTS